MRGSRRWFLRSGAAAGASGLGATSGCLEPVVGAREERVVDETRVLAVDDALSAAETGRRIEGTIDDYGRYGFWGAAEATPEHEMDLVGGWYDEAAGADGGLDSAHLLALYYLPGRTTDGEGRYLLWFWTGARPTGAGEEPVISRVETGVALATDAFSMGQYAPTGSDGTGDAVPVGLGIFDVRTPRVELPVDPAAVGVVPERTGVGDGGGFTPVWTGETKSARSLLGACEISGTRLDALELEWRTVVSVRA